MPDIFLSYSRDDQATARRFAKGFERAGLSVWWDQTLSAGEAYDEVTEKALNEARAVVVLWSRQSVGSRWVRAEATQANDNKTLVPVMIEPCKRPIMFELTHTAELAHWKGDAQDPAWQTFLADLTRFVRKDAAVPAVAAPVAEPAKRTNRRGIAISMAAVALLLAGSALWYFTRSGGTGPSLADAASAGTTSGDVSLAVLPFVNLSSDPEQEYFSDGLSEELLNVLAQIKELRVAGRTSSFSFKGKNEDLRVIGEQLGVENLLEGSVRKSGDQLRITAQLINAKSGYHLWSETYERKLEDIFAIQEDISKSVANALSITLGVGDLGRLEGGTRNVAAYDLYLKARQPLNAAASLALFRGQLDSLEEAVKLDPSFALAWSVIAQVSNIAVSYDDPVNAPEWRRRRDDALSRAREIAPNAVQVLSVMAVDAVNRGSWTDAERTYRKAMEIRGDALLAGSYGGFLVFAGKSKIATEYLLEARRIEPLDALIPLYLGVAFRDSGKTKEALAEYGRGIRLGFSLNVLNGLELEVALAARDHEAIRRHIDIAEKIGDVGAPIHHAMLPFLDRPGEGLVALRRLAAEPDNTLLLKRAVIAIWAAYFRDADLALAAMKDFSSASSNNAGILVWLPLFRDMRKLPGFKDLVRQNGLVAYWREVGWGDFCKPVGTNDFECQ